MRRLRDVIVLWSNVTNAIIFHFQIVFSSFGGEFEKKIKYWDAYNNALSSFKYKNFIKSEVPFNIWSSYFFSIVTVAASASSTEDKLPKQGA